MKMKEICKKILTGISEAIDNAKDKILELAKTKLENTEKKAELDCYIENFIMDKIVIPINFAGFDSIAESAIRKLVNALTPVITQKIFDLMKAQFSL